MLTKVEIANSLSVISRAWGRTQEGYVFFPWIDREEQKRQGIRRAGYHEGPVFFWNRSPEVKAQIIEHLYNHQQYDVYWCPSLFSNTRRVVKNALDECALWADLDEVDPRTLTEYEPTIAWETSPGRYQCLWLMASGTIPDASLPGWENQRMTYMIGADQSGWDTTQLLRIPNWINHKPEYEVDGKHPRGKLLWKDKRVYLEGEFDELPIVENDATPEIDATLTNEIKLIDREVLISRVEKKLPVSVRENLRSQSISGDSSKTLWYLTRCLADVGCTIAEIVAITQGIPWNKFLGRSNETTMLIQEAGKAIGQSIVRTDNGVEEEGHPLPISWADQMANVKQPEFLVKDLIIKGSCGFIAGLPKGFKSWLGLDLAISVATGSNFLNHFMVTDPGPVLYIQEEDSVVLLNNRGNKIASRKERYVLDTVTPTPTVNGVTSKIIVSEPVNLMTAKLNTYIRNGFTISEEDWIVWLEKVLLSRYETVFDAIPYKLIVIDTLGTTLGNVDENKMGEMNAHVFRPLKRISELYKVAIMVVHHMGKGNEDRTGGVRMIGSTAGHAWSENSLFLSTKDNTVKMMLESKSIPSCEYTINGIVNSNRWHPDVSRYDATVVEPDVENGKWESKILEILRGADEPLRQIQIRKLLPNTVAQPTVSSTLTRLVGTGKILKHGQRMTATYTIKRATKNVHYKTIITTLEQAGETGLWCSELAEVCGVDKLEMSRLLLGLMRQHKVARIQRGNGKAYTLNGHV